MLEGKELISLRSGLFAFQSVVVAAALAAAAAAVVVVFLV